MAKLSTMLINSQFRTINSKKVDTWRITNTVAENLINGLCANEHIRIYNGDTIQLSGRIERATKAATIASADEFMTSASRKSRFDISINYSLSALAQSNREVLAYPLPAWEWCFDSA